MPGPRRPENMERHQQYYQGVGITELHGLGCGHHLFGTPRVPFQAPFECDAFFEVMSGTRGAGSGGIRLCGPEEQDEIVGDVFLIPFQHVGEYLLPALLHKCYFPLFHMSTTAYMVFSEQIIVLPNPRKPAKKAEAYLVIIVPTAAAGASSVKREYPQIVSFAWPDRAADKKLAGTVGGAADGKKDTYLSVVKQVFDEQLKPFGKSVVDVSGEAGRGCIVGKDSTLKPPMGSRLKHDVKGELKRHEYNSIHHERD